MSSKINTMGAARGSLLGGMSAGVVCVGLYFLGRAAGADFVPKDPKGMGMDVLPPFMPMVIATVASVVAAAIFGLLAKFAGDKAWQLFLGISALVFLFEGAMSVMAFADLATVITLEIMHVPVALGIMGGIRKFGLSQH